MKRVDATLANASKIHDDNCRSCADANSSFRLQKHDKPEMMQLSKHRCWIKKVQVYIGIPGTSLSSVGRRQFRGTLDKISSFLRRTCEKICCCIVCCVGRALDTHRFVNLGRAVRGKASRSTQEPDGYSEASQAPSTSQQAESSFRYESDNMWDYKPPWCQPTTIISFGTAVVLFAYQISGHSEVLTAVAAGPILVWWYLFLVLVPQQFKAYVQQQRRAK